MSTAPARAKERPRALLALSVPEGVPIELELASFGERLYAFMLDVLLLVGLVLGLFFLIALAGVSGWLGEWSLVVLLLLGFFLRSGWFLFLELKGRGRSLGKRAADLRVVDAEGAPLTVQAIVARNLMREVELWIPLGILAQPEALLPGASGPVQVASALWALGLVLFPAFHPTGARLGDLVAGTRVVRAPKARLLPELASRTERAPSTRAFTHAQLTVYGVFELQTLEKALRLPEDPAAGRSTLAQVSQLIRAKIAWTGDERDQDAEPFLRDFYAALRRHLEDRLRLGKRKRDKHDR